MKLGKRILARRSFALVAATALMGVGLAATPAGATADSSSLVPLQAASVSNIEDIGVMDDITWGPVTRNCLHNESCRVRATGGPGRQRHLRDGSTVGSWLNQGTTTRTSMHGSGSQTATIRTHTSMSNPSATCICVTPPCVVSG